MIVKNLITEEQYKKTAKLLYETKIKKSMTDFLIFRRIAMVAAISCGKSVYIPYSHFLENWEHWLNLSNLKATSFLGLRIKMKYNADLFGIKSRIIVNGSYKQVEEEALKEYNHFKRLGL